MDKRMMDSQVEFLAANLEKAPMSSAFISAAVSRAAILDLRDARDEIRRLRAAPAPEGDVDVQALEEFVKRAGIFGDEKIRDHIRTNALRAISRLRSHPSTKGEAPEIPILVSDSVPPGTILAIQGGEVTVAIKNLCEGTARSREAVEASQTYPERIYLDANTRRWWKEGELDEHGPVKGPVHLRYKEYRISHPGEADTKPLVDAADLKMMDTAIRHLPFWAMDGKAAWSRIRQSLHTPGEADKSQGAT